MPFDLELPNGLLPYKVKIFDLETGLEDPHVTILLRTKRWRISLRSGDPMDREPPIRDVLPAVLDVIEREWETLKREWDRLHPNNKVADHE